MNLAPLHRATDPNEQETKDHAMPDAEKALNAVQECEVSEALPSGSKEAESADCVTGVGHKRPHSSEDSPSPTKAAKHELDDIVVSTPLSDNAGPKEPPTEAQQEQQAPPPQDDSSGSQGTVLPTDSSVISAVSKGSDMEYSSREPELSSAPLTTTSSSTDPTELHSTTGGQCLAAEPTNSEKVAVVDADGPIDATRPANDGKALLKSAEVCDPGPASLPDHDGVVDLTNPEESGPIFDDRGEADCAGATPVPPDQVVPDQEPDSEESHSHSTSTDEASDSVSIWSAIYRQKRTRSLTVRSAGERGFGATPPRQREHYRDSSIPGGVTRRDHQRS